MLMSLNITIELSPKHMWSLYIVFVVCLIKLENDLEKYNIKQKR